MTFVFSFYQLFVPFVFVDCGEDTPYNRIQAQPPPDESENSDCLPSHCETDEYLTADCVPGQCSEIDTTDNP